MVLKLIGESDCISQVASRPRIFVPVAVRSEFLQPWMYSFSYALHGDRAVQERRCQGNWGTLQAKGEDAAGWRVLSCELDRRPEWPVLSGDGSTGSGIAGPVDRCLGRFG